MEVFLAVLCAISATAAIVVLIFLSKQKQMLAGSSQALAALSQKLDKAGQDNSALSARQDMLIKSVSDSMATLQTQLRDSSLQSEQKLENIRRSMSETLEKMQQSNTVQLENIRKTVDEKLQDTLDKKLNESFKQVSERLEQVYKGLGEMQTLASGVGDLKRVLSNVKTRGILGEIQLGAILEHMLSPEQYSQNVATKKGSQGNVEYAVKLPGDDGGPVWLPIDSKFPMDAYEQLLSAYDAADQAMLDLAIKGLRQRVRGFAKDIRDKYISPPDTTDFAIMFLPTEGLYAEVVRAGLVEELQRDFKVNIAGPTTMGALLNSLQMGFKTLAIQKRSSEVWKVLGSVKTEFDTFADVLEATKKRLDLAGTELDKLVGVRTRKIQSTLKNIQSLPSGDLLEQAQTEE